MATTTRRDGVRIDLAAEERRQLRACTYVRLPFEEVVARFGASSVDDVLAAGIHAALGLDEHDVRLEARSLEVVAGGVARLALSWWVDDALGGSGTATLSILSVQRGHDPLTEILADLRVAVATAPLAAEVVRRFLAELDRQLSRP